jgi:hypothetical protein
MRHLSAIAAVLALSSSAVAETATERTQSACTETAYQSYLAASLDLSKYQQGVTMSIEDVIAKRRLMEGFCVQFLRCASVDAFAAGAMFSKCLDDEDADRLNDGK